MGNLCFDLFLVVLLHMNKKEIKIKVEWRSRNKYLNLVLFHFFIEIYKKNKSYPLLSIGYIYTNSYIRKTQFK